MASLVRSPKNVASRYLFALATVAVAVLVRMLVAPLTGTGAPFVLFFGATLLTSLVAGTGPASCTLLVSLPLAAYLFVYRAGYTVGQATTQGLLYAMDGAIILYLTRLAERGRRGVEATNERLREANEEVTRAADRMRQVVELAPDAFFQADLDARYDDVNQAACELLGYTREELIGKTLFDLISAEEAERLRADREVLLTPGQVLREERALRRKDGRFVTVEVSAHILPGGRWQAFARDISERKRIDGERQVAAERLRESEERFRLIFEDAPIGMALLGLDGRFVRVNRRLCDITGYSAAELEARRWQDITHPEDLDPDLALAEPLIQGAIPRYQLEKRYIRKDGSVVPIMLSASALRHPDEPPRYVISQIEDITERKRAEEALRLSEAKFSGIVAISADAIVSIDLDQKITIYNDGAEKIFGYSKAEALGAPLGILIPPRLREQHAAHVRAFAAGDVVARRAGDRHRQIIGLRKNGEEFPAEAAISKLQVGDSIMLNVALRDVTDRVRGEKEQRFLAEAGRVLTSTLDYEQTLATVSSLVVRDFADWCVVEVMEEGPPPRRLKVASAQAGREDLCRRIEALTIDRNRPYLIRSVNDERRPKLLHDVTPEQLAAAAQSPEHLELLRAIAPVSLMAVPLLRRDQLLGLLVFVSSTPGRHYTTSDLHVAEALADRAAAAIENARLYRTALRASQLRDHVLGIVAHDLRNPLGTILLQAAALSRDGAEERRSQRSRDVILRAATRMNHLIQDLLDVALIEAGQLRINPRRLAVDEVVAEVLELQRARASAASVELRLDLAGELPHVLADLDRLHQVFENLIGNALKFTSPGGRVSIGAAPRAHEVLFWVSDTGAGIDRESLGHVFDRFWQADHGGPRVGAGLGLPIAKGIVEAHHGRIWVESALGRGSTFFFVLPTADAPSEAPVIH